MIIPNNRPILTIASSTSSQQTVALSHYFYAYLFVISNFSMSRSHIRHIMSPILTYKLHPAAAASSRVSIGTTHGPFPNTLSAPLKLRNSSYTTPTLIYGTAWKKQSTSELVYQAIKSGFRGVDTAGQPRHYREDLVGSGIRRAFEEGLVKREDLFVSFVHFLQISCVARDGTHVDE